MNSVERYAVLFCARWLPFAWLRRRTLRWIDCGSTYAVGFRFSKHLWEVNPL